MGMHRGMQTVQIKVSNALQRVCHEIYLQQINFPEFRRFSLLRKHNTD